MDCFTITRRSRLSLLGMQGSQAPRNDPEPLQGLQTGSVGLEDNARILLFGLTQVQQILYLCLSKARLGVRTWHALQSTQAFKRWA